jgi:hypothetical protein
VYTNIRRLVSQRIEMDDILNDGNNLINMTRAEERVTTMAKVSFLQI